MFGPTSSSSRRCPTTYSGRRPGSSPGCALAIPARRRAPAPSAPLREPGRQEAHAPGRERGGAGRRAGATRLRGRRPGRAGAGGTGARLRRGGVHRRTARCRPHQSRLRRARRRGHRAVRPRLRERVLLGAGLRGRGSPLPLPRGRRLPGPLPAEPRGRLGHHGRHGPGLAPPRRAHAHDDGADRGTRLFGASGPGTTEPGLGRAAASTSRINTARPTPRARVRSGWSRATRRLCPSSPAPWRARSPSTRR